GACPGPVGAEGEGALAGVGGEAGGDVPDAVAERVRLCVPQFLVVVVAEEAVPGGEVGGDVRGDDPSCVDLPRLGRQVAQAHGLGGADAVGLDGGVVAVQGVDELGVVAARDLRYPGVGDVRAGDGVLPARLLLVGGEVLLVPARRLHPARNPAQPVWPAFRPGHEPGDLRDVLVL